MKQYQILDGAKIEYEVKAFPSDWATYFGKKYEVDDDNSWTEVRTYGMHIEY